MQTAQTLPASAAVPVTSGTVAQAVSAMLFGLFIIGTVGFSQIDVLHNAAHDTRHSNAFPCH